MSIRSKLILLFWGWVATCSAQRINTLADLRKQPGTDGSVIILLGTSALNDGNGDMFYWSATDAQADNGMSVIKVTGVSTGSWIRLTSINSPRVTVTSAGTLITTGTKKEFYAASTINSSSESAINLTTDGTATGTAIFSQILYANSTATIAATTATDVVFGSVKSITTNNKTITFRYAKGNSQSIVIGGTAVGVANAVNGTVVNFIIIGF